MRLSVWPAILAASALGVGALSPERQVLITYPNDTPDSTMIEAKNVIEAAGGRVLHEFELLKGFIVKASTQVLDSVHTLSNEFQPYIEDDETVTIQK
ncbi:MAG: hypothetical protein HETSPECPRED_009682 [Heterodermia speciosa]|uniref:Inhibitor I9 domain-containing protein n=1 Tax=Heterodermia speciosa TaxID=116794 RepID=A0A8H3G904_9LECA|nr:MAG: hypothetical protein HETSPECPRED_009682 [Heterodermia speciosa]